MKRSAAGTAVPSCSLSPLWIWISFFFFNLLPYLFIFLAGVPRETEKEKEVADFDIFDDPESPFSTFNFQYSNEAFTRLHDLMEFNTLNNLEVSSVG